MKRRVLQNNMGVYLLNNKTCRKMNGSGNVKVNREEDLINGEGIKINDSIFNNMRPKYPHMSFNGVLKGNIQQIIDDLVEDCLGD